MTIYYVEDDSGIRELVLYALEQNDYKAVGFESGDGFIARCVKKQPDLILLDIMLPGDNGFTILSNLKKDKLTRSIPVIIISAKDSEYDKVKGLDLGADDYIAKPFGVMELLSRIKALLRRTKSKDTSLVFKSGKVKLDKNKHIVSVDDKEVILSPKEFELLEYMLANKGIAISRDMILNAVWGYDFIGNSRTVDVHMQTLRQKLGKGGDIIQTVRGLGYRVLEE